jgi:protein-disulfide isomerase
MAEDDSDKMQVKLSARTLILGAFVLGLTTGMVGGLLVGSLDIETKEGDDTGNTAEVSGTPGEVFTRLAGDVGADKKEFKQCLESSKGEEYKEDMQKIRQTIGRIGTPTFFIGNSQVGYQVVSGAQPLSTDSERNMVDDIEQQIQEARNGDTTIDENETALKGINLEGEPSEGDSSALINVIEYSDYGCPYCSEWAGFNAIPDRQFPYDNYDFKDKLVNQYVDSGEVRFVYKDYPVENLHPNAPQAHEAANCVLEQDQDLYWKFHDKLFEYQESWKQ